MSVESMAIALHHSRAKGTARLVLVGIANHDGDGGAWPSVATLAKYAACSTRQVQRCIAELVRLGEIDVKYQQGGTQETPDEMRPNRYTVLLRCPGDCDRTSKHRTSRQLRLERGPGRPRNRVTPTSPGDTHVTGGGDTHVTRGVTPTSPEPSMNHPAEHAKSGASATEGVGGCGQPMPHSCDGGWLDDEHTTPCLLCKPHLARRRRRAS